MFASFTEYRHRRIMFLDKTLVLKSINIKAVSKIYFFIINFIDTMHTDRFLMMNHVFRPQGMMGNTCCHLIKQLIGSQSSRWRHNTQQKKKLWSCDQQSHMTCWDSLLSAAAVRSTLPAEQKPGETSNKVSASDWRFSSVQISVRFLLFSYCFLCYTLLCVLVGS